MSVLLLTACKHILLSVLELTACKQLRFTVHSGIELTALSHLFTCTVHVVR